MSNTKSLTLKEAQAKAESFCAYQERTQQEVRNKLYNLGLYSDEVEEIIAELITGGFINEERYAKAYAGGKFRMKHWGRQKIRKSLQSKGISPYCLEAGLREIDEEDYLQKIDFLIQKKLATIKENKPFEIKHKLAGYLMGKGFEPEIIWERVSQYFLKI